MQHIIIAFGNRARRIAMPASYRDLVAKARAEFPMMGSVASLIVLIPEVPGQNLHGAQVVELDRDAFHTLQNGDTLLFNMNPAEAAQAADTDVSCKSSRQVSRAYEEGSDAFAPEVQRAGGDAFGTGWGSASSRFRRSTKLIPNLKDCKDAIGLAVGESNGYPDEQSANDSKDGAEPENAVNAETPEDNAASAGGWGNNPPRGLGGFDVNYPQPQQQGNTYEWGYGSHLAHEAMGSYSDASAEDADHESNATVQTGQFPTHNDHFNTVQQQPASGPVPANNWGMPAPAQTLTGPASYGQRYVGASEQMLPSPRQGIGAGYGAPCFNAPHGSPSGYGTYGAYGGATQLHHGPVLAVPNYPQTNPIGYGPPLAHDNAQRPGMVARGPVDASFDEGPRDFHTGLTGQSLWDHRMVRNPEPPFHPAKSITGSPVRMQRRAQGQPSAQWAPETVQKKANKVDSQREAASEARRQALHEAAADPSLPQLMAPQLARQRLRPRGAERQPGVEEPGHAASGGDSRAGSHEETNEANDELETGSADAVDHNDNWYAPVQVTTQYSTETMGARTTKGNKADKSHGKQSSKQPEHITDWGYYGGLSEKSSETDWKSAYTSFYVCEEESLGQSQGCCAHARQNNGEEEKFGWGSGCSKHHSKAMKTQPNIDWW